MPDRNEQRHKLANNHARYKNSIITEQVRQLYTVAPVGFIAALINSAIVFFVTQRVMNYPLVLYWLIATWSTTLLRILLVVWFRSVGINNNAASLWKKRYLVSLAVSGTAWGSIGLFPFMGVSLSHQVFLAFVLGGMAAGASSTFAMVKWAYVTYSAPALLPLAGHFLFIGGDFHYAMAAMLLLFGTLLWRLALYNHSINSTSLLLRFENREIINELKEANERTQDLITDLRAEIEAKLRAEAELKQYHEHLERLVEERTADLSMANKELEQFAYLASHDLRAPLRAVANLAAVIDEDVSEGLDEENRGRLKQLRERVRHMDALIEGMLAYARIGKPSASTTRVALADLVKEIHDELPLPPGFMVEWEESLPCLEADPVHIRQIFQNLIANAIQHHDHAAGHVWVRARDAGKHWQLEVADDGPGIPEEEREQVFRMFTTASRKGHTGIGLAVVRKLAAGYGAQVEALPNQPRGAVFRITWPKE